MTQAVETDPIRRIDNAMCDRIELTYSELDAIRFALNEAQRANDMNAISDPDTGIRILSQDLETNDMLRRSAVLAVTDIWNRCLVQDKRSAKSLDQLADRVDVGSVLSSYYHDDGVILAGRRTILNQLYQIMAWGYDAKDLEQVKVHREAYQSVDRKMP